MEYPNNFIKTFIEEDKKNKNLKEIITRFPPEPNGCMHIGHARAIITNFELGKIFNGYTNLRYDDTNPSKENDDFVAQIKRDIEWLGYKPKNIYFASNYFDIMIEKAKLLIKKGLAYVDFQTNEEISLTRGTLEKPGINSIYRDTSKEVNLELFEKMINGEFKESECILRAKIDMSSPNINMRDPAIYRIMNYYHHNTKDKYKIYPMYDFAHPLEDAIEGITHSLCSLEFEDHRPLYDWVVNNCEMTSTPRQIEFGRLSIENSVMSKRYLKAFVTENYVDGWDDPRLPTISGLRRKGYTPNGIKEFIFSCGLSKVNSTVPLDMLEHAIRNDLNITAPRLNGVVNPIKLTITNYDENKVEYFSVPLHPDNLSVGEREVSFSKHLYIESDDFVEVPPDNKYKRLALGLEVRLMHSYFIKAYDTIKDDLGNVVEVLATYDPLTRSGLGFKDRKPNGTIHYVNAKDAISAEFLYYGPLIDKEINETTTIYQAFNVNSLTKKHGFVENYVKNYKIEDKFQLVRNGFYCIDKNSKADKLIINETVPLKSSIK